MFKLKRENKIINMKKIDSWAIKNLNGSPLISLDDD